MDQNMFDCPEQSQTSPTRTSLSVRLLLPVISMEKPVVSAAIGLRNTSHSPSLFAVVT